MAFQSLLRVISRRSALTIERLLVTHSDSERPDAVIRYLCGHDETRRSGPDGRQVNRTRWTLEDGANTTEGLTPRGINTWPRNASNVVLQRSWRLMWSDIADSWSWMKPARSPRSSRSCRSS